MELSQEEICHKAALEGGRRVGGNLGCHGNGQDPAGGRHSKAHPSPSLIALPASLPIPGKRNLSSGVLLHARQGRRGSE